MLAYIGSGNGLVPEGTKPLPEAVITHCPQLTSDNEIRGDVCVKSVNNHHDEKKITHWPLGNLNEILDM